MASVVGGRKEKIEVHSVIDAYEVSNVHNQVMVLLQGSEVT